MTRKRYVKLLMAAGVKRNVANRNAEFLRGLSWSYRKIYDEIMKTVLERDYGFKED